MSTRKRDAQIKRRLFEQVGVREYWLVDPELDTVQVRRLTREGRLARVEELTADGGGMNGPSGLYSLGSYCPDRRQRSNSRSSTGVRSL